MQISFPLIPTNLKNADTENKFRHDFAALKAITHISKLHSKSTLVKDLKRGKGKSYTDSYGRWFEESGKGWWECHAECHSSIIKSQKKQASFCITKSLGGQSTVINSFSDVSPVRLATL